MKSSRPAGVAVFVSCILFMASDPAIADVASHVSPAEWQKPNQVVSAGSSGKNKQPRRVQASQGGSAMLPGAAGIALGLVYHKTIKCLDKPRPPKNGC